MWKKRKGYLSLADYCKLLVALVPISLFFNLSPQIIRIEIVMGKIIKNLLQHIFSQENDIAANRLFYHHYFFIYLPLVMKLHFGTTSYLQESRQQEHRRG